ncbi:MAG: hypothetical protein ACUVX1_14390 [Chloroflexota bacterium]
MAEYRRQMVLLTLELNSALGDFERADIDDREAWATSLTRIELVRDQIKALDPPASDRPHHTCVTQSLDNLIAAFRQMDRALERGDADTLGETIAQGRSALNNWNTCRDLLE